MKTPSSAFTLAAALLLATASSLCADCNWKTAAGFEVALPAAVDALTKDTAGNLYAAVSTSDSQRGARAQIRKSSDRGTSWTVVEELFTPTVLGNAKFTSLATGPAGQVYAAGFLTDDQGQTRWLVKQGNAGGTSWATVDDFHLAGGQTTVAQAITVDKSGHVYVAGFGDGPVTDPIAARRMHWLVRQSRDAGQTWSTIEDFGGDIDARAMAILSTPEGLFVAGSAQNGKPDSGNRWLVRRGIEDASRGFRWEMADDFQMQEQRRGFDSQAQGLAQDGQGNLYAVGRSYAVSAGNVCTAHWVVRRASKTGQDWAVVDTYQMEPGSFAAARAVAAGHQGIFVVGQATDEDFNSHWVVRRSNSGAVGTWSVCDDFESHVALNSKKSATTVAPTIIERAAAGKCLLGLAILCDADQVLAGGSTRSATSHAVVRKMETRQSTRLAAAE